MNVSVDLFKKVNVEKLAREGQKVYDEIKNQYEPKYNGKYLAIEPESKKAYIADDGALAMTKARKNHPNKLFFLVKIGFSAAETIARSYFK